VWAFGNKTQNVITIFLIDHMAISKLKPFFFLASKIYIKNVAELFLFKMTELHHICLMPTFLCRLFFIVYLEAKMKNKNSEF